MKYNENLWKEYTEENLDKIGEKQYDFIYNLVLALGAKRICEAGCNIGNNLRGFPINSKVYGFDMSKHALEKAKSRYPSFHFKEGNLNNIPFKDEMFDLVFTRGVLVHIHNDDLDKMLIELLRISKKWVFNLEYFGEDGNMINWKRGDDLLWHRNMKEQWNKFDVEIVSDIEIPIEVDPGKVRLTLIRKNKID